jgi:SPP1 family predicted phage head-tail adaptor
MKAGELNRQVTIVERSVTQDPVYGTDVVNWNTVKTVYAKIEEILPSRAEDVSGQIALGVRTAKVTIRWREGITQKNRVIIDGQQMGIIAGPSMVGFKVGLEFVVQALSTEGQEL